MLAEDLRLAYRASVLVDAVMAEALCSTDLAIRTPFAMSAKDPGRTNGT